MYIYADWFPGEVLGVSATVTAESGGTAAGRAGMAGQQGGRAVVSSAAKTSQQAIVNTTRTLTWLLEILHEEFREVYTVIQERLRLKRERHYAVPA
jgi:hypothetical protein